MNSNTWNSLTLIHTWSIASVKALDIYRYAKKIWFDIQNIIVTPWATAFYIDAMLRTIYAWETEKYQREIWSYSQKESLWKEDIYELFQKEVWSIAKEISHLLNFWENNFSSCFGKWQRSIEHITAARVDNILVAPASAHILAGVVSWVTNSFALETIRAFNPKQWGRVFIAPAMNTMMLDDPAIQEVLEKLHSPRFKEKYTLLPSESKLLACWEEGNGAMLAVNKIFSHIT